MYGSTACIFSFVDRNQLTLGGTLEQNSTQLILQIRCPQQVFATSGRSTMASSLKGFTSNSRGLSFGFTALGIGSMKQISFLNALLPKQGIEP